MPDVAFVGVLGVPSGDEEFRSDRIDPGFRFAFGNALSENVSLTDNPGMPWLTERGEEEVLDTRSYLDRAVTFGLSSEALD